jgi:SnoaL-like polyketide cyclase
MAWSMRMLQAAFSDRRWEIHQVIAEDDTMVLDCTFHGRHTGQCMGQAPTSRSFAFRQVHIIRFQDDMAIEHWAVPDDLDLARQLGPMPRPPSQPALRMPWPSCCRTCTRNVPLRLGWARQHGPSGSWINPDLPERSETPACFAHVPHRRIAGRAGDRAKLTS